MNKWLQNDLWLRVVSVALAIMLWGSVTDATLTAPTDGDRTQIRDISVAVKYDKNRFELVEQPQKVVLTLYGDNTVLERLPSTYRVFVDARKVGAGVHSLPVQAEGLPNGITKQIEPKEVEVHLEEKVQKEMMVQAEFVGDVPEGFRVSLPIINPSKVLVRGSESTLDKVTSVKVMINLNKQEQSFNKPLRVQAYGETGVLRHVEVNPETVQVQVPINIPNKEVPLRVEVGKGPPTGYAVEKITTNVDKVAVYGPEDYLEELQVYNGPKLDLSKVKRDQTILMPIPVQDGAIKVEPQQVEIYVKMVRAETKMLREIPIEITGLREGAEAEIISPSGGKLNITLSGAPEQLAKLNNTDIKALVDVSNLPVGTHEVPIQFILPSYVQVVGQPEPKAKCRIR
ncbi:YbbR-like domain-containing protein [Laceyella putida]|uniref:YbbR-like domain-containing protein n=1 Tax=Laceyella putida TaxID=110101 RepID=A0ABW2RKZ5_9BACL